MEVVTYTIRHETKISAVIAAKKNYYLKMSKYFAEKSSYFVRLSKAPEYKMNIQISR